MGTSIPRIELPEHALAEDYREFLSDPSVPEEKSRELKERAEDLTPERQRSFLDRIAPILDERLKVLEQKQIDINLLKRAREVQAYAGQLSERLETRVKKITPPAPQATEETLPQMGTIAEKLQKEWEEHPVRTTLTGAALVLGVLTVSSWIANRFRKASEAGRQAMQTGGSWLKRIVIATGVSLGVFLGLKAYREGKRLFGKLENTIDRVEGALQGQQALQGLGGLFGFNRPPRPQEQPPPPAPPPVEPPPGPEAQEALEKESLKLIGEGLLIFHDDFAEEAGIEEKQHKDALNSLLQDEDIESIPFSELEKVTSRDAATNLLRSLPNGAIDTDTLPNYSIALLFLAKVLRKHKATLASALRREGKGKTVGGLSLRECMERLGELSRVLRRIHQSLQGNNPMEVMQNLLRTAFTSDGSADLECLAHPSIVSRIEDYAKEVYGGIVPQGFLGTFSAYCVSQRTMLVSRIATDSPEARVLRKILDDVQAHKSYFLLYALGRPEVEEILKQQMKVMTVGDALQLFCYSHLAHGNVSTSPDGSYLQSGEGMGTVLLQLKILDLVGKKNHYESVKFRDALLMNSEIRAQLPPQTQEILRVIGSWAREAVTTALTDSMEEVWVESSAGVTEFHKAHWRWALPLEVGTAGTATWAWWKLRNAWDRRMQIRIDNVGTGKFQEWTVAFRTKTGQEVIMSKVNLQEACESIRNALMKLDNKDVLYAYKAFHRQGYHPESFQKLRAAVNTIDDLKMRENVLKHIQYLEDKAELMEYLRFSWLRRNVRPWLGHGPGAASAVETGSLGGLAKDRQLLRYTGRANQVVEDTDALMQLAEEAGKIKLDAQTLALIRQSPKAKRIIAGAIETADIDEVTRALTAAKNAAKLRVGLNAVGAVGDIFGLYMAYADWQANGQRIAGTNNPALKELYSSANVVYGAEGTASTAGLAIGGYCIVSSFMAGKGTLAALGAAGGTVMLPIAVAVGAGGYSYRKLEGVTETWLKDESDWAKETPGALRAKMKELGPRQTRLLATGSKRYQSGSVVPEDLHWERLQEVGGGTFQQNRRCQRANPLPHHESLHGKADDARPESRRE
jgi:hypothetical protein